MNTKIKQALEEVMSQVTDNDLAIKILDMASVIYDNAYDTGYTTAYDNAATTYYMRGYKAGIAVIKKLEKIN